VLLLAFVSGMVTGAVLLVVLVVRFVRPAVEPYLRRFHG